MNNSQDIQICYIHIVMDRDNPIVAYLNLQEALICAKQGGFIVKSVELISVVHDIVTPTLLINNDSPF